MLIFFLDLLRTVLGSHNFSSKAAQIEKNVETQLASRSVKVMNDYYIARSAAPLIPSWQCMLKRDELNQVWRKYRQS